MMGERYYCNKSHIVRFQWQGCSGQYNKRIVDYNRFHKYYSKDNVVKLSDCKTQIQIPLVNEEMT